MPDTAKAQKKSMMTPTPTQLSPPQSSISTPKSEHHDRHQTNRRPMLRRAAKENPCYKLNGIAAATTSNLSSESDGVIGKNSRQRRPNNESVEVAHVPAVPTTIPIEQRWIQTRIGLVHAVDIGSHPVTPLPIYSRSTQPPSQMCAATATGTGTCRDGDNMGISGFQDIHCRSVMNDKEGDHVQTSSLKLRIFLRYLLPLWKLDLAALKMGPRVFHFLFEFILDQGGLFIRKQSLAPSSTMKIMHGKNHSHSLTATSRPSFETVPYHKVMSKLKKTVRDIRRKKMTRSNLKEEVHAKNITPQDVSAWTFFFDRMKVAIQKKDFSAFHKDTIKGCSPPPKSASQRNHFDTNATCNTNETKDSVCPRRVSLEHSGYSSNGASHHHHHDSARRETVGRRAPVLLSPTTQQPLPSSKKRHRSTKNTGKRCRPKKVRRVSLSTKKENDDKNNDKLHDSSEITSNDPLLHSKTFNDYKKRTRSIVPLVDTPRDKSGCFQLKTPQQTTMLPSSSSLHACQKENAINQPIQNSKRIPSYPYSAMKEHPQLQRELAEFDKTYEAANIIFPETSENNDTMVSMITTTPFTQRNVGGNYTCSPSPFALNAQVSMMNYVHSQHVICTPSTQSVAALSSEEVMEIMNESCLSPDDSATYKGWQPSSDWALDDDDCNGCNDDDDKKFKERDPTFVVSITRPLLF